jgi:hypothetical protein
MGIYSSGSKWKNAARGALAQAEALEDQQRDVEFQRGLLSNIRQQRIAQAQLSLMNYSASFTSSSAAGASANIDSALAGEMKYSYESSQRAEDIQDYQQAAQQYMKKYAKQQKTRAMAFAVTGAVVGGALGAAAAAAGGIAVMSTAGAAAVTAGATIGQGVGQMASNTGQFETGFSNVLNGLGQIGKMKSLVPDSGGTGGGTGNKYVTESISSYTGKPIAGSQQYYYQTPNGQLKPVTGGFFPW